MKMKDYVLCQAFWKKKKLDYWGGTGTFSGFIFDTKKREIKKFRAVKVRGYYMIQ